MAGMPEITLARNGARVALVYPRYVDAEAEFDVAVRLAPDASNVNRGSGKLAIEFEGGGLLRFVSNTVGLRGHDFDQVIVHPDAWNDEVQADVAPLVATTGGVVRIEGAGSIIACPDCGQQLAVEGDGWSLVHHDDGSHEAVRSSER